MYNWFKDYFKELSTIGTITMYKIYSDFTGWTFIKQKKE